MAKKRSIQMTNQISEAKLAANRANAQHSTGPKTPEGKAKVARNARTYGLFVSDNTLEQENPQEYADMFASFIADYCPNPGIEFELVRQLTSASWRLRRLDRIETARLNSEDEPETRHEASKGIADRFHDDQLFLDRIYRARQQAERTFNRCYKELEARKRRRWTQREAPEEILIEPDTRHIAAAQNKPTPPAKLPVNPCESVAKKEAPTPVNAALQLK